jgi:GT2 family glycosyltransferase
MLLKSTTDVSIVIVNWNVRDLLRDCITSIYEETEEISFEIIVVDNASSDGSVDMIKKEFPQIKLIKNKENVGFSKANNQAIKLSKGKYILMLNPDTVVLEGAI